MIYEDWDEGYEPPDSDTYAGEPPIEEDDNE